MPGRLGWQEDAARCVEMQLAEAFAKFPGSRLVGSLPIWLSPFRQSQPKDH